MEHIMEVLGIVAMFLIIVIMANIIDINPSKQKPSASLPPRINQQPGGVTLLVPDQTVEVHVRVHGAGGGCKDTRELRLPAGTLILRASGNTLEILRPDQTLERWWFNVTTSLWCLDPEFGRARIE